MFIAYTMKRGVEYATLTESVRKGEKVGKGNSVNLGRVLDKERGIYRNRERGVFTFCLKTLTYGPAPADFQEPPKRRRGNYIKDGRKKRSLLVLQFGDIFFYDCFVKKIGISEAIDAINFSNLDTLHSLICYYVTSQEPNSHAEFWHCLSYAKVLFPKANMSSQRISEALAEIGLEENRRTFFRKYIEFATGCQMNDSKGNFGMLADDDDGTGVLIDSTGLPNSAKIPVTAISNHNGIISNEVRVIYVVHQRTGLPLFMRYVAGNVIDASTIKRTLSELKGFGVDVKFALLDAGYYNGENADALLDAGVSFVTRVHSNNKIFKDAVAKYRTSLESRDNLVRHNSNLFYIQRIEVMLGSKADRKAYGYLCLDMTTQFKENNRIAVKAFDENLSSTETFDYMQESGLFMIVATRPIAKDKILPLYYTRNQVEELFRIGKGEGKMLPINVQTEDTLRGHMLITLISTAILKILQDRLIGTGYGTEDVFSILRRQVALVYPNSLITSEPVKKMNDIYKKFGLKCPEEIPYTPSDDESARM